MTVGELIESLRRFDKDTMIVVESTNPDSFVDYEIDIVIKDENKGDRIAICSGNRVS